MKESQYSSSCPFSSDWESDSELVGNIFLFLLLSEAKEVEGLSKEKAENNHLAISSKSSLSRKAEAEEEKLFCLCFLFLGKPPLSDRLEVGALAQGSGTPTRLSGMAGTAPSLKPESGSPIQR